ncbi:MAG TPA: translation elongation factor Ts [Thermomicrobiales bacterium]|nr:translation elongation factor Ts [Thermomicrobiales bacterium]HRA32842.1 translation elongation factor Ts [Thermomicrobiales bacterium]
MSTALVKELRERTGAGIMECKRALEDAGGDLAKAAGILREQGAAKASKKAGRSARQGIIETYIHGGRIGAMVEVNCETDFVARTDDFKHLVKEIAMQIAATNPTWINNEDVPADARSAGVEEFGDEKHFLEAKVLLTQPSIRDPKRNVGNLVQDAIAKIGENIIVRRFARFELGEMSGDADTADE